MIKQAKWKQSTLSNKRNFGSLLAKVQSPCQDYWYYRQLWQDQCYPGDPQVLAEKYRKIITHKRGGLARLL